LPLSYNRDLQEDKEPLFAAHDTLVSTLTIMAEMTGRLRFRPGRTRNASGGFLLATDVADYLAMRGMPFREAHNVTGRIVAYCESTGKDLRDLTLEEYRRFSGLFDEDVRQIDVWSSVRSRDLPGGTAPRQVAAAIRRARTVLKHREE
jgi:argininosuccinate lyase